MALDVSGSQIYAGRYHYRRSEMPDLFRGDVVQSRREKKSFKEQYSVDTMTFSEEGMVKAKAKDWRAYTIDNPDISHVNIKGLSFSNFSWQSEKISAKESCLYGIISIRITPFLDVGL